MKFKKCISKILSCSLLSSIYASCVVSGTEKKEGQIGLKTVKDSLDDAEKKALVPYEYKLVPFGKNQNKNQQQDKHNDCFICKENPISYFMPLYTPEPISEEQLKNSKVMRCTDCGKLFHDICAVRWIEAYTTNYGTNKCPCPSCKMYCLRLKEKKEKLLDQKLKKYENEDKLKTNFDFAKLLKDPKNKYILAGGGLVGFYLLLRKPVVVNVNYEKR